TGMYGMFAIQESVRQLRGEGAAQVPDVELRVVVGNGGMFASAATLVLSNRMPWAMAQDGTPSRGETSNREGMRHAEVHGRARRFRRRHRGSAPRGPRA